MANGLLIRHQLMTAVAKLPAPTGKIGTRTLVTIPSLRRQDSRERPGQRPDEVEQEQVEFELAMLDTGQGLPTPMWLYAGRLDLNVADEKDTDKLRTLMEVALNAKHLVIQEHQERAVTFTAWFKNKAA